MLDRGQERRKQFRTIWKRQGGDLAGADAEVLQRALYVSQVSAKLSIRERCAAGSKQSDTLWRRRGLPVKSQAALQPGIRGFPNHFVIRLYRRRR